MPMKLYAHPDNYKTHKALIAAKYAGLDAEALKVDSASGKIPVLETDQGAIFSSMAIARYLSRISRPAGLYGQNLIEGGMVDSWVEFCTHELEVPLITWVLPALKLMPEVPEATACAKDDVKKALTILNNHLLHNTFMVGHSVTLADISLCCSLADGFKVVLDADFCKPFGNILRWFSTCMQQPEFKAVLGDVKPGCAGAKGAQGAGKKQQQQQQQEPAQQQEKGGKKNKEENAKPKAAPKDKAAPKKDAKKGKDDKTKEEDREPTPEELEKAKKDRLKKVVKEGGKRGVEIEGAADMGGLQFFCTSVAEPEGDLELLEKSMEAMNTKSDPTDEERKGGSGHIGKMIFSAGTEQLAVVAYVPESKQSELICEEWLAAVVGSQSGEVVSKGKATSTGCVKTNADKGIFPLKIREGMILEANNFLRKKGLFPEDKDDSDDDYIFGDDDFPS